MISYYVVWCKMVLLCECCCPAFQIVSDRINFALATLRLLGVILLFVNCVDVFCNWFF